MKQQLKEVLSAKQKKQISDEKKIPSAVLLPLYIKEGQYHILFTQRTHKVRDHKGQISFPGGGYEEQDNILVNTALRESAEEIGLAPGDVEVLGELDDIATIGSGYVISPFVGIIPWPYQFELEEWETEEIIEVPISALLDKDCLRMGTDFLDGKSIKTYFYHFRDKVIWGATARILTQFLEIWQDIVADR